MTCFHYGRNGHTEFVCYRKHDFPPNFENRRTRNSTNRNVLIVARMNTPLIFATRKMDFHQHTSIKNLDTKQETKIESLQNPRDQDVHLSQ